MTDLTDIQQEQAANIAKALTHQAAEFRTRMNLKPDQRMTTVFPRNETIGRAVFQAAETLLAEHNIEVDWSVWDGSYDTPSAADTMEALLYPKGTFVSEPAGQYLDLTLKAPQEDPWGDPWERQPASPLQDLLDEITRDFLHPELAKRGITNPEQYKLAYEHPSPSVQDQLTDIAAMFRLAAEEDGEDAVAQLFEYLRDTPAIVTCRPALTAIIRRVHTWVKED